MRHILLNDLPSAYRESTSILRQAIWLISLDLLLAITIAACNMPAAAPLVAPAPPAATPTPAEFRSFVKGKITSPALAGNLVGDSATKPYLVYLPPSYPEGNKHYPVIYAISGWNSSEYQIQRMGLDLDELIASGDAPEMIVVFANSINAFRGSWWPRSNSPTVGDYRTYLTRDLVDHIDANFRTIPQRDSRGIVGCGANSGSGAINLAFAAPDVFSVAVGMSGVYDYENDPALEAARRAFQGEPQDFSALKRLPWQLQTRLAIAAGTASNPNKPPFYLDMPFEMVDGEAQIVSEVVKKMNASDTVHLLPAYLDQPTRLRAMMIAHGEYDAHTSVKGARAFDELLNQQGVDHEYLEAKSGACQNSGFPLKSVIQFMAKNLSFEMPQ